MSTKQTDIAPLEDDIKGQSDHVERSDEYDMSTFVDDPEIDARIKRKVDYRILPPLWCMYWLNYLDRTNIGNAKTAGMGTDLKLTSNDYSLAVSIFFIGYLLLQVPSNMILNRTKPRLYLPGIMLGWGCMVLVYLAIHNVGGLIAVRFCLGFIEAGFFPGALYYLSRWYKRTELAKQYALFYSAAQLAGAFGGLLSGAILSGLGGRGGLPSWKWLFLIEAVMTIGFAFVSPFILPDWPHNTSWLTVEERKYAVQRILAERAIYDGLPQVGHKKALAMAFKDWKVWLLALSQNLAAASGTVTYFIPTLTGALGYTGRMAQFMTVPIYATTVVCMIIASYNSDRVQERPLHLVFGAGLGVVSAAVVAGVTGHPKVRYAFLCLCVSGIYIAVTMNMVIIGGMWAEVPEKRAIAIAIFNGVGNLASVYGSYIWPSSTAPRYIPGWVATACFMVGVLICGLIIKYVFPRFPEKKP